MNPIDLRLVVGKGKVETLAARHPGAALAVNASFFDTASYAIWSNVAQGGRVIAQTGKPHPYLAVQGHRAWFGRGTPVATQCDWAAGAGPMLLEGGVKAPILDGENYGKDILGGDTIKTQRMAVGIAGGRLCFITLCGTFGDLRRELVAAGCTDAMNLDGGGSAQWVENGKTVVGKDERGYIRPVVNALVAMKVEPTVYEIKQMLLPIGKEHNRPGTPLRPEGIVMHETATPGATPEDEAVYFATGDRNASAHFFVGPSSIVQIIPENEQAQHAGPTANSRFLGIEMCHFKDAANFAEVWRRSVWLAAKLCKRYGWTAGPNIYSHKWASDTFRETTHQDPYAYLKAHGRTFQEFCDAVDATIPMIEDESEVDRLRAEVEELRGELAADEVIISDLRRQIAAKDSLMASIKNLAAQWK